MKRCYLSLMITIFSLPLLSKHNQNILDNQYNNLLRLPATFFEPVQCNKISISNFFETIYNHPLYGPQYFAYNMLHVADFIRHAESTPQPRNYIAKSLNIFSRKLYSLLYVNVNSTAFYDFYKQLPTLLPPYFNVHSEKQAIKKSIQNTMYQFLSNDFHLLKADPTTALENLSEKLYSITIERKGVDISIMELRTSLMQFLEISFDKLIWSAVDQKDAWELLKAISYVTEELHRKLIITDEQMDTLMWLLIYRFAYFLELEGSDLAADFYSKARSDLSSLSIALWASKETFPYCGIKERYLQQALMAGEIRSQAGEVTLP